MLQGRIQTTGHFRDFLIKTIQDVKDGELDLAKARAIAKLAGQVNENIYAEIKVAQILAQKSQEMQKLGDMQIGVGD